MSQKQTGKEIYIFLASSSELELERVHAGDLINDINSALANTDVRVRLLKWENFNPSFQGERKQSEYNEKIKKSHIFIAMFREKTGKFTLEEVEIAVETNKQTGSPHELYCFIQEQYEKNDNIDTLKAKLNADWVIRTFLDIKDFKQKLINILIPYLIKNGINITETDNFIQINPINIFKK